MTNSESSEDWVQVKARTDDRNAEKVSDLLESMGSLAVTYMDAEDTPILEPLPGEHRLWPNIEVTGLFDKGTDPEPVINAVKDLLGQYAPVASVPLHEKDWIRAWMDQFKPMKFGSRLWICPSWLKVEEENSVVVKLDPGLAFGTGTHPTTAQCLTWLDSADLKGLRVLDYGCGSGILGISALKLGAESVTGVDIDEQALIATKENALRNGVADRISLVLGKPSLELEPFPVTVANILAGPLAALEPYIAKFTQKDGRLALSGILTDQADEVIEAYSKDFRMDPPKSVDGWVLLTGIRL